MPRVPRMEAESSLYHLTTRTCGRQRLFEGNPDRIKFVNQLADSAQQYQVQIKAWCLMENHVHVLAKGDIRRISQMMHKLSSAYALRFNKQWGHTGHVFQGRYHSNPVESEEQLLATIRYIHLNPVVGGLGTLESYPWSSYSQYLGAPGLCEIDDMCRLFGSASTFRKFHELAAAEKERALLLDGRPRHRMSDDEAAQIAASLFGKRFADRIVSLPRLERDAALQELFKHGISDRQVERLTGIGRNIVQRARAARK